MPRAAPLPLPTVLPPDPGCQLPLSRGTHSDSPQRSHFGRGWGSLASCSSAFKDWLVVFLSGRFSGGRAGNGAASLGQTAWNSAAGSCPAPPWRQRRGAGTSRVSPRPEGWGCSGLGSLGMLWMGRDVLVWGPQGCCCLGSPRMLWMPWDTPGAWGCSGLGSLEMLWFGDAAVQSMGGRRPLCTPRGCSPGRDAAPEAAVLGVAWRSKAGEEGAPVWAARSWGQHPVAAPAAGAMLRTPLTPWAGPGVLRGGSQAGTALFLLFIPCLRLFPSSLNRVFRSYFGLAFRLLSSIILI